MFLVRSAFFCYADDRRDKIKKEKPGLKVGQVAKLLGEEWGVMNESQKAPYEEQAKKLRAEYEVKMAEFRKKQAGAVADDEDEEYTDED